MPYGWEGNQNTQMDNIKDMNVDIRAAAQMSRDTDKWRMIV